MKCLSKFYIVSVNMIFPKYRLNLSGYYLGIWHRHLLYNRFTNNISHTICGDVYDLLLCQVSLSYFQ